ncbi:MAG: glucose-6-phosphate dehydrogenase [Betaproteobacteria bacterium]|nr:glucose-6-phosphate dehydrogenase [Betaproteobacteria bacterium]
MPAPAGCVFVIFGATGDLMRRKLLPALFHLFAGGQLPARFHVLGVARSRDMTDAGFRQWARSELRDAGFALPRHHGRWCDRCLHYQRLEDETPDGFKTLARRIEALEREQSLPGNRVFYLALPPQAFAATIEGLGRAGLNTDAKAHWTRLVIEKPFGRDLASALALNELVHRHFRERQIYRIDHYLGKDTVQNLLALRFGNALFESVWNRQHVKCVHITVAEELGVEERGAYYEETGAVRDMLQNHLAQLLTLTAMEPPGAFTADSVRFEKIKVLRAVESLKSNSTVLGQYAAGARGRSKLPAYRREPGVARASNTATFVAARVLINNWRWQGVPFFLRTGKRLARRMTEIAVHFHRTPVSLFKFRGGALPHHNALKISIQPDEGFALSFEVKTPGGEFELETRNMEFRYRDAFGELSAGYETLLLEILEGDQTLFVHADETIASWSLFGPLLKKTLALHAYAAGSWGPPAAARLLCFDGILPDA